MRQGDTSQGYRWRRQVHAQLLQLGRCVGLAQKAVDVHKRFVLRCRCDAGCGILGVTGDDHSHAARVFFGERGTMLPPELDGVGRAGHGQDGGEEIPQRAWHVDAGPLPQAPMTGISGNRLSAPDTVVSGAHKRQAWQRHEVRGKS
jgi:hypothetical protein